MKYIFCFQRIVLFVLFEVFISLKQYCYSELAGSEE